MDLYREDVQEVYDIIMNNFCKFYYDKYDNNFDELRSIYTDESLFTYLDEEIIGFSDYKNRIKSYGIYKFIHYNISPTAQPVGNKTLIISVTGNIRVNYNPTTYKFSEVIMLQREKYSNNYFVYNTIFKLID